MKHLLLPSPLPLHLHGPPSKPLLLQVRQRHRHLHAPSAAPNGNSGDTSTAASEPSADTKPSPPPPSANNSSTTSVKNRLRSRNQARRAPEAYMPPVEVKDMRGKGKGKGRSAAEQGPRREKQQRKKEWDEMSLSEKAMELYVGEKGALFWLNKFAYASIFIMAGAWILFRFVGPATGLYQLDAPPLAPTDVLRGS